MAVSGATLAAGSAAVLAACGAEEEDSEPSAEDEAQALDTILAGQLALTRPIADARKGAPDALAPALPALAKANEDAITELRSAIDQLGSTPTETPAESAGAAESPTEALRNQLLAAITEANTAAYDLGTPDLLRTAYTTIFTDAAYLSAVRDALGEDPAPDAFTGVAGAEAPS